MYKRKFKASIIFSAVKLLFHMNTIMDHTSVCLINARWHTRAFINILFVYHTDLYNATHKWKWVGNCALKIDKYSCCAFYNVKLEKTSTVHAIHIIKFLIRIIDDTGPLILTCFCFNINTFHYHEPRLIDWIKLMNGHVYRFRKFS